MIKVSLNQAVTRIIFFGKEFANTTFIVLTFRRCYEKFI